LLVAEQNNGKIEEEGVTVDVPIGGGDANKALGT